MLPTETLHVPVFVIHKTETFFIPPCLFLLVYYKISRFILWSMSTWILRLMLEITLFFFKPERWPDRSKYIVKYAWESTDIDPRDTWTLVSPKSQEIFSPMITLGGRCRSLIRSHGGFNVHQCRTDGWSCGVYGRVTCSITRKFVSMWKNNFMIRLKK